MTAVSKRRNSAMEILRIIAMFFIIYSHFIPHGATEVLVPELSLNSFFCLTSDIGNIGVVIFVILSGYFSIHSSFRVKKVFQLISQVVFYSVIIYIFTLATGIQEFNLKNAIMSLFPTSSQLYWFFTSYIILYIFSPFINKMLNGFSQSTHLKLIIIMLVLWCIAPTFTGMSFWGNEITQFVMFYCIGAYLRKYPDNLINKNSTIISVTCAFLLIASPLVILKIGEYLPGAATYATHFFNRDSVLVIGLCAALVSLCSKIKPFYSKALNTVAACTFGIYLIHDNRFFRTFMWQEIFNADEYIKSPAVVLYIFLSTVIIFAVCCVIELLRKNIIEKPTMKLYDTIENKVKTKFNKKA